MKGETVAAAQQAPSPEEFTYVGPVVRAGDIAQAVIDAVKIDNPDREVLVDDRAAYVRVHCPWECVIREETMTETLGRPFRMRELEVNLASFAGQIEFGTDYVRFYYQSRPNGEPGRERS
jgi:toluene monooxygenase system protein D